MSEILLRVTDLAKYYGERTLFAGVGFEIWRGDKVALVGPNGAGKTTLVRCLLNDETADGGQIIWYRGCSAGYVAQTGEYGERTVLEELKQAYRDVLAWEARMRELEQQIAVAGEAASAEMLAEYADVMSRFEHADGYAMDSRIRQVSQGLGFSEQELSRPVAEFSGGQKTRIAWPGNWSASRNC